MWIDDRGVIHTVALPDPTELMTAEFQQGFDSIAVSHRREVQDVIDATHEEMLDADVVPAADEVEYAAASPPVEILRGEIVHPSDVRRAIRGVAERWRLDAVLALDEYLG